MNLIKIGTHVINLDLVTHYDLDNYTSGANGVRVFFAAGAGDKQAALFLKDKDAELLRSFLADKSTDIGNKPAF